MTKVSIVIPCFNDGAFLREAVSSALAQLHDDCEVIVADDGSTDDFTARELDAMSGLGVRVIHLPHAGVSATRNAAIEQAAGEYVLPLDADDRLSPHLARDASLVLDRLPEVGIVGAPTQFFGSRSDVVRPGSNAPSDWIVANHLPVSAMFRRDDWVTIGGYAQDLAWGEDWHFWVKVIALGRRVHVLPDIGFFYRRRPGQVTADVPWELQEKTRARVLQAGLPIINAYPQACSDVIASQLNQLAAMRARRSEQLRARLLTSLRSVRR